MNDKRLVLITWKDFQTTWQCSMGGTPGMQGTTANPHWIVRFCERSIRSPLVFESDVNKAIIQGCTRPFGPCSSPCVHALFVHSGHQSVIRVKKAAFPLTEDLIAITDGRPFDYLRQPSSPEGKRPVSKIRVKVPLSSSTDATSLNTSDHPLILPGFIPPLSSQPYVDFVPGGKILVPFPAINTKTIALINKSFQTALDGIALVGQMNKSAPSRMLMSQRLVTMKIKSYLDDLRRNVWKPNHLNRLINEARNSFSQVNDFLMQSKRVRFSTADIEKFAKDVNALPRATKKNYRDVGNGFRQALRTLLENTGSYFTKLQSRVDALIKLGKKAEALTLICIAVDVIFADDRLAEIILGVSHLVFSTYVLNPGVSYLGAMLGVVGAGVGGLLFQLLVAFLILWVLSLIVAEETLRKCAKVVADVLRDLFTDLVTSQREYGLLPPRYPKW